MVSFTLTVTEFTSVQVHANHLCSSEAHLGNLPKPPPDAILAPPFFSPCQMAELASRRNWSTERTEDEIWSSSGPEMSSGGEPMKAKKYVKRRAKVMRKPADSSDDEEESAKQRLRRRRRVNHVPALTTSDSEDKVANSGEINISSEWETNQTFAEAKVKTVPPAPTLTTSDSEDEVSISGEINISSEWKTYQLFAEQKTKSAPEVAVPPAPTLTSSDSDEDGGPRVVNMGAGSMKGGAGETYEEVLREAIKKSGQLLKLDHPTRGDGNCCSRAMVQQCQRAPVRLYLQAKKVTIDNFMQLKHNVSSFIQENSNTPKVRNMRMNFELSQQTIHHEGMRKRTWRQYWVDMEMDAGEMRGIRWLECWADDTWLQAASWYLDMPVVIIWAGDDTQGRMISTTDGHWTPLAEGEQRPRIYLGYIVRAHYQSLLPLVEDRIPQFVAQPAIDKTLQNVLRALEAAQAAEETKRKQGTQVNYSKITVHIEP